MSHVNRVSAFASGILLYFVSYYAIDFMFWPAFPRTFHELFGTGYQAAAVILVCAFAMAMPCFIVVMGWTWVTLNRLAISSRAALNLLLGGVLIGDLCWRMEVTIRTYSYFQHVDRSNPHVWYPSYTFWDLASGIYRGWWGVRPEYIVVVAGLVAGAWVSLRSKRPPSSPHAQVSPQDSSEPSRSNDQPGHTPFVRAGAAI